MAEVKWIKLSVNMFEDEKIRLIEALPEADTILVIWVKLLAQAGKTNATGYIYLNENIPYTDEMLATIFNRPIPTVRLALKAFEQFGMIEISDDHFISITNWEKHQNIDGLEKIREQERIRKQRQREKKKNLESRDSHGTVTIGHATEEEREVEEDKDRDIDIAAAADTRPLLQKFISLRGYGFDHSPIDEKAAEEILDAGVNINDAITWLEEKFKTYKPKHKRDRINSLDYCVGFILDKHYEKNNGGANDGKKYRRGHGRAASESKEPIFGNKVGRY
ncbi:phage replisome organizer N-terminal domain-containing protein [Bacillus sp. ISL-46]|uniref:phage replisome organizer N-terminal domain-containing protein n=1 Tax=Bacillus sp. ISL-46 TaxID=2819129 RepID=UPI001BEA75CA|nr:phage replisome organizer N-terminal domain-containing protein [Bacillus sp. ISL-46]MBT2722282.1 phage replisome organizer N-terminal domain-containing protein [Bacillus sp. ISL-46]